MQASRQQLFDTLVSSGLIAAEEVRSLQKSLPRDEGRGGLRELSRLLVAEKRLTAFQARAVREGRIDELVLGNYLLLESIGQGGMGEVFKARHRRMDRVVAVKLLRTGPLATEARRQRFQREVKAAAKLSHPNIVAAYDADEVAGRPFLVMEYVDGCDLAALVEQFGPLSVGEASECLLQIAAGLEYAHAQGVIHRDLKPSNVLADRQGRLKILDLGLARLDEPDSSQLPNAARLTASGQIMGTVDYMAPEQAIDSRRAGPRADIYSLGCTLFYLLTGRPVYPGDSLVDRLLAHRQKPIPSLHQPGHDIPDGLDAIFQQMLAKQPEQRIASANALVAALEAAGLAPTQAAGQLAAKVAESARCAETPGAASAAGSDDWLPPVVEPVRPPPPPAVRPHRLPIVAVTAGLVAAALLAVVAGGVAWWPRGDGDRESPATPGPALAKPSGATGSADSSVPVVPAAEGDLDRRAALRVLLAGGSLEVYVGEEKRSVSSQEDLPRERFEIAQIGLGDRPVCDEDLKDLQGLARVEELALWNTAVSDAGLRHLGGLTALQALYLNGTAVRGPGLERLTGLKRLELNGAPIDDAGLRYVARLTHLECLYLDGTVISDEGLKTLQSLASLKELHLEQTRVTPEGVARLRTAIPGCQVHSGSERE